ncbi:1,4-alpha-glucan branching protein GlgB [Pseudomonas aeruginosa]|uniref:1,4-alpha-glucan branching protein GlgB n=1 Tax=Pseudomonas aeruginosa TaxID=287 RepID=UPI003EE0AB93
MSEPMSERERWQLELDKLQRGLQGDPFAFLGPQRDPGGEGGVVRAYLPGAQRVELLDEDGATLAELEQSDPGSGLFQRHLERLPPRYRLRVHWPDGVQESEDPYAFGPLLGELDLYLFAEGNHRQLASCLGAQLTRHEGVEGVRFAVWAPNAVRVSVVGDFNGWDGRRHPMRRRYPSGVWELFVPRLGEGELYKYELQGHDGLLPLKADPLALACETPPGTASKTCAALRHEWRDQDWLARRAERQGYAAPLSIYEVHAGSWRHRDGRPPHWSELAEELIPYVRQLGFTHIELMPVMEHPFGGSWGYQPLGLFAPTARYGTPEDFAAFVDACHQAGIGVILDWVPAHFPTDAHGLGRFDGTALYEYEHPFEGFHQDWDTYIYNLGRSEVHGFMLASALHWLRTYHVDGLRVDAVASMLYRDYSRKEGEWLPNRHGGRENLEAIDFLHHLNQVVASETPGALVIAEESTAWPGVSRPVAEGGLGFSHKWNMGWMHDSLAYIGEDPLHRRYHHHQLTFGLLYAFSEHFILPISHDEVVHGKHSLLDKMPGDRWQKFANLRLYLSFMWSHPGKKLLFMGCEFGQWREWNHDGELDWYLLRYPEHQGVQDLVAALNRLYRDLPALHARDGEALGFEWLIGDDQANSVYAWLRHAAGEPSLLAVHNFTPVPRQGYRIGVPQGGDWDVLLNSDAQAFAGSGSGSQGRVSSESCGAHGQAQSLVLDLPPLGTLLLRPAG